MVHCGCASEEFRTTNFTKDTNEDRKLGRNVSEADIAGGKAHRIHRMENAVNNYKTLIHFRVIRG